MAVMPAPVTVVPMTVVPMMAMPVVAPADLLRLQPIDLGLRNHRGLHRLRRRSRDLLRRINRRQRRGIRNADQRRSAGGHSDREFQNSAKFHPVFSLHVVSQEEELRGAEMNAR